MIKLRTGNALILGLTYDDLDQLRRDGANRMLRVKMTELNVGLDIWVAVAENDDILLENLVRDGAADADS